jgi:hypothetical protein
MKGEMTKGIGTSRMKDTLIENPQVAAVFNNYPEKMREKLMFLRQLILETAAITEGVGQLEETLKWGQLEETLKWGEPSYLTPITKSGSTVRIDWKKSNEGQYAIYFKCTTNLVETFREKYPTEFRYGGNRSIIFNENDEIPVKELSDCIALALTYHLRKKLRKRKK